MTHDDHEKMPHGTPRGFTVRSPEPEDAGLVADLLMQTDWAGFFEAETVARDLAGDWRAMDLAKDSWLVFAPDGTLAAHADLMHHAHTRLDATVAVRPDHLGDGLGIALLAKIEARAREHVFLAPPDSRVTIYQGSNATNERAARLLERAGYSFARSFWMMERRLDDGVKTAAWPSWITARAFVPGEDERAVYEAQIESFRDHWGDEEETFEQWSKHNLEREDHDPTLWFVAEAEIEGRKEIAGVSLCRARSKDKGWVDILGVKRPWRGRGLGEALLLRSFDEFRRRGMETVGLGVDSESLTGAARLYKRAGMEIARQSVLYRKELGSDAGGVV